MTFDEIFQKGKEGKLSRFSAYDFLKNRIDEISNFMLNNLHEYNKTTDKGKKLLDESVKCSDLASYLVNPSYSDSTEYDIAYNQFLLDKAKFEGKEKDVQFQKTVLERLIKKRKKELDDLLKNIKD